MGGRDPSDPEDVTGATLPDPPTAPAPIVAPRVGTWSARATLPARYVVRGRLGAGAMGEVHLCYDERTGRNVAVKMVRAEHTGDGSIGARFLHEARVQGRLEHPAIVPVHDIETAEDGAAFFTMKRVKGESLRVILDGLRRGDAHFVQRYGTRRLLTALSTVCLAAAFAHARGVVHRDIKPSNIMLGEFGEVYLLDWGVAHTGASAADTSGTEREPAAPMIDGDLTREGDVVGTVGFMPPEQMRGEEVDARADVYALGATLFEVLTLEPLHPREEIAAATSTLEGADARASVRAPHRGVPPELEGLCVRATAPSAAERPDAKTMHDEIEAFLDGERDREMRRARSVEHAMHARSALAEAMLGGAGATDARERALSYVNQAIALDGENPDALEVLRALVTRPADEASGETDAALLRSGTALNKLIVRTSTALFAAWVVVLGMLASLGVRMWWPFVGASASIAATVALLRVHAVHPRSQTAWGLLVSTNVAAAFCSMTFGPFLILPGVLSAIAVAFAVASRPPEWLERHEPGFGRLRAATIVTCTATFVGMIVLELAGVLPASIAFHGGAIELLPRAVDFPAGHTIALLVIAHVVLIAAPAVAVHRARDHIFGAERRALRAATRVWALLPREARDAAGELASMAEDAKTPEAPRRGR